MTSVFLSSFHLQAQEAELPESDLEVPQYGDLFLEDPDIRELSRFSLSTGYALDLDDSFSELHSVTANAQIRLWKYVSTGVFFQYIFPDLSQSGQQLKNLSQDILVTTVPQPLWGAFSHTQIQIIVGRWNLFNVLPLDVDLLAGGGLGVLNQREDTNRDGKRSLSYLWTVEQRVLAYKHYGLFFSVFGHKAANFIAGGLSFRL